MESYTLSLVILFDIVLLNSLLSLNISFLILLFLGFKDICDPFFTFIFLNKELSCDVLTSVFMGKYSNEEFVFVKLIIIY